MAQVENPKISDVAPNGKIGKYGGTLVRTSISDPKTFNPVVAKETSSTTITGYIFEGLVEENGLTTEVEPALAESWEFSSDGLVWTFRLRRGVRWFDGRPFTADDVVFTFNDLIYNEKIATSARDILTIDGEKLKVEKVDTYTVKFTLPKPFAPLLRSIGQEIMPKHLLADAAMSGNFDATWGVSTPPSQIVGTGPFIMKEYRPSDRVILEKNPNWWKIDRAKNKLTYIDRVVVLIVPDVDTDMLKFQSGETHVFGLSGRQYPVLKPKERDGNYTVYDKIGATFGTNFLVFNQNPGKSPETGKPFVDPVRLKWFTNKKFRQAMAHLIDKESMVENIYNNLAYNQISAVSQPAKFFYNSDVKTYEYNIERAKGLLAEAGFRMRGSQLVDPDGNPVEFTMATNAGNIEREKIGTIIKEDMESVGIKVNFTPIQFNKLVEQLTATYDWEAIIIGLTGGVEPHNGRNVWHSSGQLHMWNPVQEKPATAWEARVDEIFDRAATIMDQNKRRELYNEYQEIIAEEAPLIYTVAPAALYAVRNTLENVVPTAYGGSLHNLEQIFFK
jgi:peptide/nickel transport system substrate-binding protein